MKQDKIIDKIVYVVTRSEEHSDYVEAVFFNKENAEKYCKQFNDNEDEYSRDITEVKCLDTQPTNHWHKVEDGLPPVDKYRGIGYFSIETLFTDGKYMFVGIYSFKSKMWIDRDYCFSTGRITHWMELPELPKDKI